MKMRDISKRKEPDPLQCLTIKEAARLLTISERTVYKLVSDGSLKVKKLGGRTVVPRKSVQALLRRTGS